MISICSDVIKELLVYMKGHWCITFSLEAPASSFYLSRLFFSSGAQLPRWNLIRLNCLTDFPSSGLPEHLAHIPHTFFIYYLYKQNWTLSGTVVGPRDLVGGAVLCRHAIFSQLCNAVLKVLLSSSAPSTMPDTQQRPVIDVDSGRQQLLGLTLPLHGAELLTLLTSLPRFYLRILCLKNIRKNTSCYK